MEELINIDNLSFGYDEKLILHHVSFSCHRGEFIGITGENGSGKSTFLKILIGFIKVKKGIVNRRKNLRIAYVDQITPSNDISFPATVSEILDLGIYHNFWGIFTFCRKEKTQKVIDKLNIGHLLNKQIQELSGGQQQKVFLAKSLLSNPDLLILDEPTTGIDKSSREDFLKQIQELNKEGTAIIMISHRREDLDGATVIYCINDEHMEEISNV